MSDPVEGAVEAAVSEELPDLRLWSMAVPCGDGPSPEGLKDHLKMMSSRWRGSDAVALRSKPIPHAYRVFFRHIGLDPDVDRVPVEQAVVDRLMHGGFKSTSCLADALTVAVIETNVPVWALDADRVHGALEIRRGVEGELLGRHGGEYPPWVPQGRLVVADEDHPLAVLFGAVAPGHGVTPETERILLFSVQVAGVPAIHVSEALWLVRDNLEEL